MVTAKTVAMPKTIKEIKKRLQDRNLRQKDLAEALGISPSAVSQMMNGTATISRQHMNGFVKILGENAEFWQNLIETDMNKEQEKKTNICAEFKSEAGETLVISHPDNYQENPEEAAKYMASLIINLHGAGFKPAP